MNRLTAEILKNQLRNDGLDEHRVAFISQKSQAERRGIEWGLTFEQWLEWWGADLAQRGCRAHELSMQRFKDEGPYALGNVYKGTPQQNADTRELVRPVKKARRIAARINVQLDAEMRSSTVGKRRDEVESEDETWLREQLGYSTVHPRHDLPVWG